MIVDDVLTTGGHVRAAAAVLKGYGVRTVGVASGVLAEHEPVEDPFAHVVFELEEYERGR